MRKVDNKLVFSPSDLITFMDSVYDSWMERYSLEYPNEFIADEADESVAILQKHGNQHELDYLSSLRESGRDVCEIVGSDESAELATIAAMREGREIIYQGVLTCDQFSGRSDFLFRVPGNSQLGDYHYEVWDTKLSKKAKPYFVVQLCCYAEMLERIQGRCPDKIKIVLGDGSEKEFTTVDYIHFYRQLKNSFVAFQNAFSKEAPPDGLIAGTYSRWKELSERMLEDRDDLVRVANIRRAQIERLKKSGINTLNKLTLAVAEEAPSLSATVFETLKNQAELQTLTVAEERVAYKLLPPSKGKGLALLPPASNNDVFFDMEGYPHIEGGLEYLFGAVLNENKKLTFRDWWAHDRSQEKLAFEQFVDFVFERWSSDPSLHVYHYAPYEVSALRRLAGRHATRVDQVDCLLRNEVFVDLYQIVRQAFLVGVPSYSIKHIEHLYRPKRTGTVAKASESVVYYERWLQSQDGDSWEKSGLLKDIRDYNEADCVSTEQLAQWLWGRQEENQICFTGKVAAAAVEIIPTKEAMLADELLLDAESIADPETKRVQTLLANLLEYHKREDKPMWWRHYDRQKKSDSELFEDLDCLAGLTRTKRPPYEHKKSYAHEYSFDPNQDTKLQDGDGCVFLHDLDTHAKIADFDRVNGLVSVVVSSDSLVLPTQITLLPFQYIGTRTLQDAIGEVVLEWSNSQTLPGALRDLLYRNEPNIRGRDTGEPIAMTSDTEEALQAIQKMDDTTLCIQGPPGCGKTYLATHAIVELLRANKRVGITSNSHKAIEHLLKEVLLLAEVSGVGLRAMKIGGSAPAFVNYTKPGRGARKLSGAIKNSAPKQCVEHSGGSPRTFLESSESQMYNLVAGTAWCFCSDAAEQAFDYLFVEEAGQVCLANVVGMARSARNLVLLGDQMQLEQPTEGSHPGESGLSSLEYFLQGHATIPPNLGIFLGTTRRMHPAVCKLISEGVYEGRIKAASHTARQILSFPDDETKSRVGKEAGIVWMPVEHQGNSQASDEEVSAIKSLIADLLHCQYTNKDGVKKQISLNDILIVAPYNMQVRKIAAQIPGAQVASVDKFQGREAAVVILSMCASEAGSSPRGLEFLFSKSRLNVAISRAQSIAFVVGSSQLCHTACTTLQQMTLLNFFCKVVEEGKLQSSKCRDDLLPSQMDTVGIEHRRTVDAASSVIKSVALIDSKNSEISV